MITTKNNFVPASGPTSNPCRHRTGIASTLGITHHFSAGNGLDQLLGQFDLQRTIKGIDAAAIDLCFNCPVDHLVGVPQNNGTYRIDPVDELVAIDIDKTRPLGLVGVDWADAVGKLAGPTAY